jgi:hypothetical protein
MRKNGHKKDHEGILFSSWYSCKLNEETDFYNVIRGTGEQKDFKFAT